MGIVNMKNTRSQIMYYSSHGNKRMVFYHAFGKQQLQIDVVLIKCVMALTNVDNANNWISGPCIFSHSTGPYHLAYPSCTMHDGISG
jgi:hypothetical protein